MQGQIVQRPVADGRLRDYDSALEEYEGGSSDDQDQSPSRYLTVLWRRKWILAIAGLLGLVIGFVYTFEKPRIYQSSAQVMLSRKKQPTMTEGTGPLADTRTAYLDDYVTTQLLLLKSDLILRNAAKNFEKFSLPGAASVDSAVGMLGGGLGALRDKDTAGRGGNVVMLTFRSSSQEYCARYLESIISSYQEFLQDKFDAATNIEIKQIEKTLKDMDSEIKHGEEELVEKARTEKNVFEENPEDLKKRISNAKERIDALEVRQASIAKKLALIAEFRAKDSPPKDRPLLLAQLSIQAPGTNPNGGTNNGNNSISALDALIRSTELEVGRMQSDLDYKMVPLGNNHPEALSMKSRLNFLKNQLLKMKEANGGNGGIEQDVIEFQNQLLDAEKGSNEVDLKTLKDKLERDTKLAQTVGLYTSLQTNLDEKKKRYLARKEDLERTKRNLEATKNSGGYEMTLLQPPEKSPVYKVEPNMFTGTVLGGFLGLLIGIALAALAEVTDRTFHTPDEIRTKLGVPVIAHIPTLESNLQLGTSSSQGSNGQPIADPSIICYHTPKSRSAESIRGLRTSIYFSLLGRGHQVIQVTSPNPADGKSTLISNLAVSIAQSGKKIVLIDADMRKPRIHKLFPSVSAEFGLSSVVIGEKTIKEAIQPTGIENLSILPVGQRPSNPAELLSSPAFRLVLEEIRKEYDFILIDTPPLLAVSDPAVVASCVDGLLLVIRIRPNIRPAAERARTMLRTLGVKLLGVVVNSLDDKGAQYGYGYSYGYGYNYGYGYKYAYNYDYEYADKYNLDDVIDLPAINDSPKKG
ncbi:polysaccharide biosynthesis tyrosine autokinase [Telmatocola sphagniphila]|uniref:non-specific protein-tyrosine kinase n=1 Tax=Telmatocola sphagniphila TaxID=1123043 RepID=A0A8E6B7Z0_9BACT|nr:polysaccharide biosynthesis tyrosine autokinase [Telmatocola sphagniphila]QVL33553.1 polysaccharide biosynthesis tyrosine autokinase [Telmatocola sphagniphila]